MAAPRRTGVLIGIALGVLIGCAEPRATDPDPTVEEPIPPAVEILDPVTDALREQVQELREAVVDTRGHLQDAVGATSTGAARRAATDALRLLLAEPAGTAGGPGPLFPSSTADRGSSGEQDDALTVTLGLARDAGGTFGRSTVEVLRDPVAGDLGAWERDAQGVVAAARAATADSTSVAADLEALTATVLELPGDGTRALAWAIAATEATGLDDIRVAADRADAHLSVVQVALDLLLAGDTVDPVAPAEPDGAP